ncbi:MAG: uroporphyrinogen decarboxylase family protein [Anaerolineae bacterium]
MLTSRERVLTALDHQEPDRVPIFVGTSGVTTLLGPAYERLKAVLGVQAEPRYLSRTFQYARLDEEVMQRLHSDGRPLLPGPAPSTLRRELGPDAFVDEWGITWQMKPGAAYYEVTRAPLAEATVDDLARYPWPDLAHPSRFATLTAETEALRATECAIIGMSGVTPFEQTGLLRGLEQWLMDLAADPEFAQAILRRVTDLQKAAVLGMLDQVGDRIDVLLMGDDLGGQSAPMISPATYRRVLKPLHAELIEAIRSKTRARIFYHCDGAIYPLIGDLIDVGVDILNPVQVSAGGMRDTARLKREFGDRLSFCGAVDTQWVLPHGTPDDVRREVRQRIRDLAPGGGYICSAVHCLQPDVPAENILAMFDEAHTAGRYPLAI